MGNRVQRVQTQVSESQLAQAISECWKDMFNEFPSKEQVSMVLAQNALETGNRKAMWNYNIGNITTNEKSSFDYFDDLKTDEQVKPGVWQKMKLKYRAYLSLKDGVTDYLKLLSGKHYSGAWEHIKNPNPVSFSKALKQSGYYTANEEPYTKTLTSLYNKFNKSTDYKKQIDAPVNKITNVDENQGLFKTLNDFLKQVTAKEKLNQKLYTKHLNCNNICISVNSSFNNSVEFSRILTSVLENQLMIKSSIHSDFKNLDINCEIYGSQEICFAVVHELSEVVKKSFNEVLNKDFITIKCLQNKKSNYDELDLVCKIAEHNIFLSKFGSK